MKRGLHLIVLLCFVVLAGCVGKDVRLASLDSYTIYLAIMPSVFLPGDMESIQLVQKWARDFHEQNPHLTVEIRQPTIEELIDLGEDAELKYIGPDTQTDIIWDTSGMVEVLRTGNLIAPVDSLLISDIGPAREDFIAVLLAELRIGNTLWGVPAWMNVPVMHCNQALFEQAGVALPQTDWTWSQFLETASALQEGLSSRQFVVGYGPGDAWSVIYAHSGRIVDDLWMPTSVTLGESTTRTGIDAFLDLVDRDLLPSLERAAGYKPPEGVRASGVGILPLGGSDRAAWLQVTSLLNGLGMAIQSGDVAMWSGPLLANRFVGPTGAMWVTFGPDGFGSDIHTVLLPYATQLALPVQTTALYVASASPYKHYAWQWIGYMLDQAPPMGLPTRRSALNATNVLKQMEPDEAALAQALAEHLDQIVFLPGYRPDLYDPITVAIWDAWIGYDLDSALDRAERRLQGVMNAQVLQDTGN